MTLKERKIAGAAIDVYGVEPLPADHPIRKLDNVLLTPHLGYVIEENLAKMYQDTVEDIVAFLDGKPIRVLNQGGSQEREKTDGHHDI